MSHQTTLLYLALRKENKIGKLFGSEREGWRLAPASALKWVEHSSADSISDEALGRLVESLAEQELGYAKVERKPITSEQMHRDHRLHLRA